MIGPLIILLFSQVSEASREARWQLLGQRALVGSRLAIVKAHLLLVAKFILTNSRDKCNIWNLIRCEIKSTGRHSTQTLACLRIHNLLSLSSIDTSVGLVA